MTIHFADLNEAMTWLEDVEDDSLPKVLLGNGFSRALQADRFNYGTILDKVLSKSTDSKELRNLATAAGTADIEALIDSFESSARLLDSLESKPAADVAAELYRHSMALRLGLVEAIAVLQDDHVHCIEEDAYRACGEFLCGFDELFTTNYDLLLYWTTRQTQLTSGLRKFRDGFGRPDDRLLWSKRNEQNVHYLHGALHLFVDPDLNRLEKLCWRDGGQLATQVRERVDRGYFPLHVSEGTSAQKLARIGRSRYLRSALARMEELTGGLLVYGHALGETDSHIRDAIAESAMRRVVVSIHGHDPELEGRVVSLPVWRKARGGKSLEVATLDVTNINVWRQD